MAVNPISGELVDYDPTDPSSPFYDPRLVFGDPAKASNPVVVSSDAADPNLVTAITNDATEKTMKRHKRHVDADLQLQQVILNMQQQNDGVAKADNQGISNGGGNPA